MGHKGGTSVEPHSHVDVQGFGGELLWLQLTLAAMYLQMYSSAAMQMTLPRRVGTHRRLKKGPARARERETGESEESNKSASVRVRRGSSAKTARCGVT